MMRIVIVEDEIRIREGMIRLISKINQEHVIVGEADNGREGMRQIEAVMPDLIITDIKMPDMDGLERGGDWPARFRARPRQGCLGWPIGPNHLYQFRRQLPDGCHGAPSRSLDVGAGCRRTTTGEPLRADG